MQANLPPIGQVLHQLSTVCSISQSGVLFSSTLMASFQNKPGYIPDLSLLDQKDLGSRLYSLDHVIIGDRSCDHCR